MIGLPDDVWVEKVHAVVALKEGQKATEEEIINFCKGQLARYKAPRSVEFVDALPKSSQGKILKREIRDKYWQGKEGRKSSHSTVFPFRRLKVSFRWPTCAEMSMPGSSGGHVSAPHFFT